MSEFHGLARVLCDSGAMLKTLLFLGIFNVLSIYTSARLARGCISDETTLNYADFRYNSHILDGAHAEITYFGVKFS